MSGILNRTLVESQDAPKGFLPHPREVWLKVNVGVSKSVQTKTPCFRKNVKQNLSPSNRTGRAELVEAEVGA